MIRAGQMLRRNRWKGYYVLVWSCAQLPLDTDLGLLHLLGVENSLARMQHLWHVKASHNQCVHWCFLHG